MRRESLQTFGTKCLGIILFVLGVMQLSCIAIFVVAIIFSKTYRTDYFVSSWHDALALFLLLILGILTLVTADKCFRCKTLKGVEICKGIILILVALFILSHIETSSSDMVRKLPFRTIRISVSTGMLLGIISYVILTIFEKWLSNTKNKIT